jgi:hypothetical protein
MPFVRVKETQRLRKTALVGSTELQERIDEVGGEEERAVAVDPLSSAPAPRQLAAQELFLRELVDAASLEIRQSALQGRDRFRRVCPPVLFRDDRRWTQTDGVFLNIQLQLAPCANAQAASDLGGERDPALLIHGYESSRHRLEATGWNATLSM